MPLTELAVAVPCPRSKLYPTLLRREADSTALGLCVPGRPAAGQAASGAAKAQAAAMSAPPTRQRHRPGRGHRGGRGHGAHEFVGTYRSTSERSLEEAHFRQTKPAGPFRGETPPARLPPAEGLRSVRLEEGPRPSSPLTGSGSGGGLDFFGLEGPPGLEKDLGSLADGDVRHRADPQGPPRRCPPPEKGTKGGGLGSSEICFAAASARPAPEVPASSWRLTSPRLSPAESTGSSGLPAACSADSEGVGLAGLLLREPPGSCVTAGSHRLMANLGPERGTPHAWSQPRVSLPLPHAVASDGAGSATGTCPSRSHASRSSPLTPSRSRLRRPHLMMALPPLRPRDSSVVLCKAALPVTCKETGQCATPPSLRAPCQAGPRGRHRGPAHCLTHLQGRPAWPLTPRLPARLRPRPSHPHPNCTRASALGPGSVPSPTPPEAWEAGLRPGGATLAT